MRPERLACRLERIAHWISLLFACLGHHHGGISRRCTVIGSPAKALVYLNSNPSHALQARKASRTDRNASAVSGSFDPGPRSTADRNSS